jgi:S1-C subfamily serine protease
MATMRQEPEEPPETGLYWPPLPPRQHHKRGGTGLVVAVVLIAAGIGAAATVMLETGSSSAPTTSASPGLNATTVSSQVETGIVDIVARDTYSGLISQGTGLVLSRDGLVLTNNHVISGSTSVQVTAVISGRTYPAQVLGYDSADDVAVLRLTDASGLRSVATGNSTQIDLGQPVLAVGNAEGRGGTPTASAGTVTAVGQTISPTNAATGAAETLRDVIETSAQVTDGDSGGALANAAGQVIGMLTAAGTTPGGDAVGFAIPVNSALRIVRLIVAGRRTHTVSIGAPGFLGVDVVNSPGSCGELGGGTGPPGSASGVSGAKICVVYPGTPAAKTGLRAGDVITIADGQSIGSASKLTSVTEGLRPGATLSVSYLDTSGHPHTARLTLSAGPPELPVHASPDENKRCPR